MAFQLNGYCDMYMIFGECHGNTGEAATLYTENYSERRHPTRNGFRRFDQSLRETGSITSSLVVRGRSRTRRTPHLQERVLNIVQRTPTISKRQIGRQVGVDHALVWDILRDNDCQSYQFPTIQVCRREFMGLVWNFANGYSNKTAAILILSNEYCGQTSHLSHEMASLMSITVTLGQ